MDEDNTIPLRVVLATLPSHTTVPFLLLVTPPVITFFLMAGSFIREMAPGLALLLFLAASLIIGVGIIKRKLSKHWPVPLQEISPLAWRQIHSRLPSIAPETKILVTDEARPPYVRGLSGDIVIPRRMVNSFERELDKVDESIILHEFGHVLAGDNLKLSVVSYLQNIAVKGILLFAVIFVFLEAAFLFQYWQRGLSASWFSRQIEDTLYIFMTILFVASYFLLFIPVKALLQSSCEYLADAFVVDVQRTPRYLIRAFFRSASLLHLGISGATGEPSLLPVYPYHLQSGRTNRTWSWPQIWRQKLLPSHPFLSERICAITGAPWLSLDIRRTCLIMGVLTCPALIIIPYGNLAPTNPTTWVMIYFLIIGYVGLYPFSVADALRSEGNLKRVFGYNLEGLTFLYIGILIGLSITALYILATTPLFEFDAYDTSIFEQVLASVKKAEDHYLSLLLGIIIPFPLLLVFATANTVIARELFSWYSFPYLSKYPSMTLTLPAIFIPYAAVTVALLYKTISAWTSLGLGEELCCAPMYITIIAIFSWPIIKFANYAYQNRRRCPNCQQTLPGHYNIGRSCEHCKVLLNDWLFDADAYANKNRRSPPNNWLYGYIDLISDLTRGLVRAVAVRDYFDAVEKRMKRLDPPTGIFALLLVVLIYLFPLWVLWKAASNLIRGLFTTISNITAQG